MYAKVWAVSGILALAACGSTANTPDESKAGDGGVEESCIENASQCDGNSFMTCSGGTWEVSEQCLTSVCDPNSGCVECIPNLNFCEGDTALACNEDGTKGGVLETCTGSAHCSNGTCSDLCAEAEASFSYLGCEYWAVDLDNAMEVAGAADPFLGCTFLAFTNPGIALVENVRVCQNATQEFSGQCDGDGGCPMGFSCTTADVCGLDADGSPFAIVVSNPHSFSVDVVLTNGAGTSATINVPSKQVSSIYPAQLGFADQSLESTSIAAKGYRLVTSAPVAAYQFNPLDNENVFSNDGSLLFPRHTFDTEYYAMTWETLARRPNASDFTSYTAVVAWKDGTEITVTPSTRIRAGQGQGAIPANLGKVFTLNAYEVLNLEAVDGDLTGTHIEVTGGGDATIAVFSGHEAVSILSPGADCCADHIEEMMLPTSTWGTEYAIARSKVRVDESDILRIMAQTAGTTVSISSGATCPTLAPGEFCQIEISGDVEITSSEPVLIGHYLKSVLSTLTGTGSGDPSLAIAVPVEQYRSTYSFLVPAEYESQYISVVAEMGANVTLDGADISGQLSSMGTNGRGAGRIAVQPGQHELKCAGGCGLEVYGYSDAVSYFFAGGLDLEQIVVD